MSTKAAIWVLALVVCHGACDGRALEQPSPGLHDGQAATLLDGSVASDLASSADLTSCTAVDNVHIDAMSTAATCSQVCSAGVPSAFSDEQLLSCTPVPDGTVCLLGSCP